MLPGMDFLVSDDGDLVFTDSRLQMVDGTEELGQRVRLALLTHRGEWFADETYGVPWRPDVLRKAPDLGLIEAVLRAKVLDVPGVQTVKSLTVDLDYEARALAVDWEVIVGSSEAVTGTALITGEL